MKLTTAPTDLIPSRCSVVAPASNDDATVRVLHLVAGNLYGGVETLLVTLARFHSLCPGMESHFGVCYEGRLSEELRAAGMPVHTLGNTRISQPWTLWRARRNLQSVLKTNRFDVVVCHMAWSMSVFGPVAQATGCKLLFWVHGYQTGESWLERLARQTVPDVVIANSQFTAGSVSTLYDQVPVRIMYYPVAPTLEGKEAHWRSSVRTEQCAADDDVVILQVSRLEPWKGHLLHLQALSAIRDCPRWVCWMAGGPQTDAERKYLEKLRDTARQLGIAERVHFLGQRSDVPQLLAAADIFCQPNTGPEPFGIVFVEALWAGRPVVTTSLGGPLEIVDETCGLMAEPNNIESVALRLRQAIESAGLRNELARGGPKRASALCDPATQLMKLRTIAKELVGQRCE